MSIEWSFESGACTTTSTHLIVDQCTMLGNGIADPYEQDLNLNILRFGWNTPDLGDNRREPAILLSIEPGRNCATSRTSLAVLRLGVPEETVSLYLTAVLPWRRRP